MDNNITLLANTYPENLRYKKFEISKEDIDRICRFFRIGKLYKINKEEEKGIDHCNPLLFMTTTEGKYVIKFYSLNLAPNIRTELLINNTLIKGCFSTPVMHTSKTGCPGIQINHRIATCFTHIEGITAQRAALTKDLISTINQSIFELNRIVRSNKRIIDRLPYHDFHRKINPLMRAARTKYNQVDGMEKKLAQLINFYNIRSKLFIKKPVHINLSLSNIILTGERVCLIDLEHIRMDYVMNDLAGLIYSCLSNKIPIMHIKYCVRRYMALNKIPPDMLPVLANFIKIRLIEYYLMIKQRERSARKLTHRPVLAYANFLHAKKLQKEILDHLQALEEPGLILSDS